jgi:hypothetical protein
MPIDVSSFEGGGEGDMLSLVGIAALYRNTKLSTFIASG